MLEDPSSPDMVKVMKAGKISGGAMPRAISNTYKNEINLVNITVPPEAIQVHIDEKWVGII